MEERVRPGPTFLLKIMVILCIAQRFRCFNLNLLKQEAFSPQSISSRGAKLYSEMENKLAATFEGRENSQPVSRRDWLALTPTLAVGLATLVSTPLPAGAELEREVASMFRKAGLEESQGNLDAALQLYNKVVKLAPDYPYGWSNRANVQVAKGNLDKAKADYSQAIEIGLNARDAWVVYLNRGTVSLAQNDPDSALKDFNSAINLPKGKGNPILLQNRAQALERLGDYGAAEKDYAEAIAIKPGDLQPFWIRYGLVCYQQKKITDALAFTKRILARFPEELEARAAVVAVTFDSQGMSGKKATPQMYAEASRIWEDREGPINVTGLRLISSPEYLQDNLHWPPAATQSFLDFLAIYNDQVERRNKSYASKVSSQ